MVGAESGLRALSLWGDAAWQGHVPEEPPPSAGVAASGPVQIDNSENPGFSLERLARDATRLAHVLPHGGK